MTEATARMDFSKLPRRELEKNETLFCEGDPGSEMYLLLSGELGVFRAGEQIASLTVPTSIVGEMSFLTGSPRAATVQALKHSMVIVVDDPDSAFHAYPRLGVKVARELATRLNTMNARLQKVRAQVVAVAPAPSLEPPDSADVTITIALPRPPAAPDLDKTLMGSDVLDALDAVFGDSLRLST